MSRKLPPLNALRAFEAAARHLSFTAAAAELNVTQAAISHQIKALEERLGLKLFRRVGRGLLLTDAAQAYLAEITIAFDRIAGATQRLHQHDAGGVLSATVLPSFAAKWLLPRLGRFRAAHPEIDLRISSSTEIVDLAREDFDVGIRIARGTVAAADIKAGRLAPLFEHSYPADYAYFLAYKEEDAERPKIAAFRAWL